MTDDRRRVAALRRYGIADTPDEPVFDAIAREAARSFAAPFSMVTFIDADRQWIKARVGIDLRVVPRCTSFCTHSILRGEATVAPDCTLDPRFAANPFVTGEPYVRFYAGAPIKAPGGSLIGTVCIYDVVPRAAMTIYDQRRLAALAAKAMTAVADRWRAAGQAA